MGTTWLQVKVPSGKISIILRYVALENKLAQNLIFLEFSPRNRICCGVVFGNVNKNWKILQKYNNYNNIRFYFLTYMMCLKHPCNSLTGNFI